MNKKNSRRYSRKMSYIKALRKQRIDKDTSAGRWSPYYNNLHQYSKGKIHCSCPLCSSKTRNKGHRRYNQGNYSPSMNYSIRDLRRILAMDFSEDEFYTRLF